jgi:alkanesulfonate monooxygenase SsuD/methylene tetrahydromethanopterin reductase-like flavin-dependent oxidoreductase (luciferase family)
MDQWTRKVALYREAAAEAGKRGSIVLMRDAFLADTREEAQRTYGSLVVEEYHQYWDWGLFAHVPGFESKADINVDSLAPHMAVGTVDDCVADLERCATQYGADYVVLCSRRPTGPSFDVVRDSILGFGSDVVPQVRAVLG